MCVYITICIFFKTSRIGVLISFYGPVDRGSVSVAAERGPARAPGA